MLLRGSAIYPDVGLCGSEFVLMLNYGNRNNMTYSELDRKRRGNKMEQVWHPTNRRTTDRLTGFEKVLAWTIGVLAAVEVVAQVVIRASK